MKRGWIIWMALLFLLAGCTKQQTGDSVNKPSAQVEWAAFQYDQKYEPAEGWMYEMTITDESQLNELTQLMSAVSVRAAGDELTVANGYRILLLDAEGAAVDELIVLHDGTISENGLICEANNAEPLLEWLNGLKLEEQNVGN